MVLRESKSTSILVFGIILVREFAAYKPMPIYLPIFFAVLIWTVMANPSPLAMLFLIARSVALAVMVAIGLFELGWIPAVRLIYFNNNIASLQFGYTSSVFAFGAGLGLSRAYDVSKRQRYAVAFLGPILATPILFPMIIILSRWNNPRSYGLDLTDLIGVGAVLLPGPISALIGCAIGCRIFSAAIAVKRGG